MRGPVARNAKARRTRAIARRRDPPPPGDHALDALARANVAAVLLDALLEEASQAVSVMTSN